MAKALNIDQKRKPSGVDLGSISIQDEKVVWSTDDLVLAEIYFKEIVVIGEYTNSNGPWFDDWFVTFVSANGEWSSISVYAANIEDLIDVLANRFDEKLKYFQLADSTQWKSLVRYPISIEGNELFAKKSTKEICKPSNIFHKLFSFLGFRNYITRYRIELSDSVKEQVAKSAARA